jgi:WD40 repeat protein
MELSGQRETPWALAFDPRSEILASGDGQTIRLYDMVGRRFLTKLTGHRLRVAALDFSPDGQWLASGSNASGADGGEVLLWDLAKSVRQAQPDYQVLTNAGLVAFERDGPTFLALADGVVTRFDLETLHPVKPLGQYGTNNVSLAVSWDGGWLVHVERDGTVHLWERAAKRERSSYRPYPDVGPERGSMRLLANGRFLAARFDGVALRIWDTRSWQEPEPWRSLNALGRGACTTTDGSRDGVLLATGQNDGQVVLWEALTRRRLASFDAHRETVMEVAFSPDGRWLASAGGDGALRLWNVRNRREAGSFRRSEAPCYGITFSPDGRRVINGGLMGSLSVVIWDAATRQHLTDLVGPGAFFFVPRFSPDGRTLAVGRYEYGQVVTCLWRVPTLAEIDAERER